MAGEIGYDQTLHFKSAIVFAGDSTFKTPMPENVTYAGGYIRYIKQHRQKIISPEAVEEILVGLAEKRLAPGLRTHFTHVRHVRQIVDAKEQRQGPATPASPPPQAVSVPPAESPPSAKRADTARPSAAPVCPRCRAPMVLRTPKQGPNQGKSFWGCTQFPRCRAIVQM